MITIRELLLLEGRWLGGQRPKPQFKIEWSPNAVHLKYPKPKIDALEVMRLIASLPDPETVELSQIMEQPNPLLAGIPWRRKKG